MKAETTRLGWHHLILEVPRTWEVIGYKTNPKDGQLLLSDRHGETMRVYWKTLSDDPSATRRLLAVAKEHVGDAMTEAEIRDGLRELHGWQTFLHQSENLRGLATRYEEDGRALLYVVFPVHPHTKEPRQLERVLKSFQPNYGDDRVWAAFGLDVTLPAEMKPARVSALPAAQIMRFENHRGESVTVHRYGMLSLLPADEDLATFFARAKGRRHLLYSGGEFAEDGRHEGIKLSYKTRGKGGLSGLLARTWQGRIWVWRRDDLERLYAVDNNALEKNLIADLPERVRCQ